MSVLYLEYFDEEDGLTLDKIVTGLLPLIDQYKMALWTSNYMVWGTVVYKHYF